MRGPGTRRTAQAAALATLLVLAAASAAVAATHGGAGVAAQRLDSRTHAALLDLYSLDAQLAGAQDRVAALEAASTRLQRQRASLQQELAADRSTLAVSQHDLELHLRDLYEHGSVDPLAVILGATSLDNAVDRLDALTSVADQSRQVVAAAIAARARLSRTRATLSREQRRLTTALSSAQAAEVALTQTRAGRLEYIAELRTEQRRTQVAALVEQAQHIEQKSQTLQPADPAGVSAGGGGNGNSGGGNGAGSAPDPPAPGGGRTMVVSATCYDLSGRTATGMPVGWGVVAVDPSVIPLGTKLYVPGYGNGVAADVGGGIKGRIIDLWMPYAKCMQWGRLTVTITIR